MIKVDQERQIQQLNGRKDRAEKRIEALERKNAELDEKVTQKEQQVSNLETNFEKMRK